MRTTSNQTNTAPAKLAALAVPVTSREVTDNQIWIRLPRVGERCKISGLSRSSLAELVRPNLRNHFQPQVEARLIKRRGATRGTLLINRAALCAFISEQPAPTRADVDEGEPTAGDSRAAILAQLDESARRVADTIKGAGL